MRRIWRILRSRRAAIGALLGVIVYAAVATTVSDGDWGVPYTNPAFLVLATFLTLSTGACAWERTRGAIASLRMRAPSPAQLRRLRDQPQMVIEVSCSDPLGAAASGLRGMRMKTIREGDSIDARSGFLGAFGSPLFHWALALLFVAIAFGQLTRAEGIMGVISGSSKPDAADSYGLLHAGPFSTLTGRVIAVGEIESNYVANGVDQGITPYVEIRSADGTAILASGYAYPNHPVRYRSMLVHINDDGLGVVLEVSGPGGTLTDELLLDYESDRMSVTPQVLGVAGPDGQNVATVAIEPAEGSTAEAPTARVRAVAGSGNPMAAPEIDAVVPEGGMVEIPGGLTLRMVRLTKYARLSVVNDWSVYPIYALFALALVGLAFALFVPPRFVRAIIVRDETGDRLHVAVRHSRGDPNFPIRVEAELKRAAMREDQS